MSEDPYLIVPDEDKEWEFDVQAHVRGASVHLDMRGEVSKDQLIGWTLDAIKSILAELILEFSNEEEFMSALKDKSVLKGRSWKEYLKEVIEDTSFKMKDELSGALDPKYKDEIGRYTEKMSYEQMNRIIQPYRERLRVFLQDPNNKVLCQQKLPEPHEWISARGRVEPGEVGATATLPGFFCPVDHGTIEYLAQKDFMHEYYLHGDVFRGKFILRLLAKTKKWQKVGREEQIWMLWRTKDDDLPYVLKKRSLERGWHPPEGKSCLPRFIRDQIPEGYEYWKYRGEKARKVRAELIKALGKEVKIRTIEEANRVRFAFKRLWWKGQVVIRGAPQIFYVLIFHDGERVISGWHFTKNIIRDIVKEKEDATLDEALEAFSAEHLASKLVEEWQTVQLPEEYIGDNLLVKPSGKIPVGHPMNPNKELEISFDTLDEGAAVMIAEEPDRFYRFKLEGKVLKGLFVLARQSPSSKLWDFKPAELPRPKEQLSELAKPAEREFVLHWHYLKEGSWMEPHWDIRIKMDGYLLEWNIYEDPAKLGSGDMVFARQKRCEELDWFITEGKEVRKDIHGMPTFIDVVEAGKVEVQDNHYEFKGSILKGRFIYNPESKSLIKEEVEYAPISTSGKNLGPELTPMVVASAFRNPIKLQDSFVFLANPERKTTGDIDIFIRAPVAVLPEESYEGMSKEQLIERISYYRQQVKLMDDWYNRALRFRLYRAVKSFNPELLERLDIRNDFRGPFTPYMPLYDLVLMPSDRRIVKMSLESFSWAQRYEVDLDRYERTGELWIRGVALSEGESRNLRKYSREEIQKMARTAVGKPITVNHGEPPYEGLVIGTVEDAEEEEGKLEFIAKITDREWIERIRNMPPEVRHLSIGAVPREVKVEDGKEVPEGLVITEISIIVPPAEPGQLSTGFQVKVDGWR